MATEPNPVRQHNWLVVWTAVLTVATLLLAVVSAIADFFIYGQWTAALNAQNDTRRQLSASVTFVGGREQSLNDTTGKTINYIFVPLFKNWGGTRTGYFSAWASVQYFDKEIPNNQDFTKPYKKIPFVGSILGPNDTAAVVVSLPVEDAIKAKDKKGTIVIWGHAEYSTLYSREVYNLQFCLTMVPASSQGDNQIIFEPSPLREDCNTGMPHPPV